MPIDRLFAAWRGEYVSRSDELSRPPAGHGSIFEQILASGEPDETTHIIWRGESCFAILNAFPYASGHLMVLPNRAVAGLGDLTESEASELWQGVRSAVAAVEKAYAPDGVNVGINLGRAAGAGIPGHVHVHVVPRWASDTNFMTSVAEARVMPESLDTGWRKLTDAW